MLGLLTLRWPLLTGSSGGAECPHMKPLTSHSLLLAGGLARSLGAGAGGIGLARRLCPGPVAREGGDRRRRRRGRGRGRRRRGRDGSRARTVDLGPALAAGSGRVAGLVVAARALRGAFARGILVRRATVAISAGCGGRSRRLGVRTIGGFGPARLARDSAGLGLAVRALVRALVVGVIERGPAIAVSAGGGRRLWVRAVLAAAEARLGWDALSAGAVWARSAARAVGVQERCAAEAVRAL